VMGRGFLIFQPSVLLFTAHHLFFSVLFIHTAGARGSAGNVGASWQLLGVCLSLHHLLSDQALHSRHQHLRRTGALSCFVSSNFYIAKHGRCALHENIFAIIFKYFCCHIKISLSPSRISMTYLYLNQCTAISLLNFSPASTHSGVAGHLQQPLPTGRAQHGLQ